MNLAFCFGPNLWFWTWTKLNKNFDCHLQANLFLTKKTRQVLWFKIFILIQIVNTSLFALRAWLTTCNVLLLSKSKMATRLSKLVNWAWKSVDPKVFECSHQLYQNGIFDPSTSLRKVEDGEEETLCNIAILWHYIIVILLIYNFVTLQHCMSARQNSWTDQLDGPVLFIWSLGQFAYLKTDLSVCTLSQLPSPTKALFYSRPRSRDMATVSFFIYFTISLWCSL